MKHIATQINFEVPDNYVFEDRYKLMEDAHMRDYDYQIIWTKEL